MKEIQLSQITKISHLENLPVNGVYSQRFTYNIEISKLL